MRELSLEYRLFADTNPTHRGLLKLESGASTQSAVLDPGAAAPQLAGARIATIERGVPGFGRIEGVYVTTVDRDSAAHASGLRTGDIMQGGAKKVGTREMGEAVLKALDDMAKNAEKAA